MSRISKLREEMSAAMVAHDASIEVVGGCLDAQVAARDDAASSSDDSSTSGDTKREALAAAEAVLAAAIAGLNEVGDVAEETETRFTEATDTSVFVPVQSLAEAGELADNEEATLITPSSARKMVRRSMRVFIARVDGDASGEDQDRELPRFRKAMVKASKGTRLSALGGVPAEAEMQAELEKIEIEEAEFDEGMTVEEAQLAMAENCYDGFDEQTLDQALRLVEELDRVLAAVASKPRFAWLFY